MRTMLVGALLALGAAAVMAAGDEQGPGPESVPRGADRAASSSVVLSATDAPSAIRVADASDSATRDPDLHFFQAGFGDLPEEMQLARDEGKLGLFVMFGAEDCPPCKKMKENVLNRPPVQDYYRAHFRVLYIDFNGDVEMTDLSGRAMREKDYAREIARVIGTPTFVFLAADGREPARHAGATRDAEEFMWLAEFVVDGAWREQDFAGYRSERERSR